MSGYTGKDMYKQLEEVILCTNCISEIGTEYKLKDFK